MHYIIIIQSFSRYISSFCLNRPCFHLQTLGGSSSLQHIIILDFLIKWETIIFMVHRLLLMFVCIDIRKALVQDFFVPILILLIIIHEPTFLLMTMLCT